MAVPWPWRLPDSATRRQGRLDLVRRTMFTSDPDDRQASLRRVDLDEVALLDRELNLDGEAAVGSGMPGDVAWPWWVGRRRGRWQTEAGAVVVPGGVGADAVGRGADGKVRTVRGHPIGGGDFHASTHSDPHRAHYSQKLRANDLDESSRRRGDNPQPNTQSVSGYRPLAGRPKSRVFLPCFAPGASSTPSDREPLVDRPPTSPTWPRTEPFTNPPACGSTRTLGVTVTAPNSNSCIVTSAGSCSLTPTMRHSPVSICRNRVRREVTVHAQPWGWIADDDRQMLRDADFSPDDLAALLEQ